MVQRTIIMVTKLNISTGHKNHILNNQLAYFDDISIKEFWYLLFGMLEVEDLWM